MMSGAGLVQMCRPLINLVTFYLLPVLRNNTNIYKENLSQKMGVVSEFICLKKRGDVWLWNFALLRERRLFNCQHFR